MGVGLGLFATGVLALMVGGGSFIREPQEILNPSPVSNSGVWCNFNPTNIVPNQTIRGYEYETYMLGYRFFHIDENSFDFLGSFNYSQYNNDFGTDYYCSYIVINDYYGSTYTDLISAMPLSEYNINDLMTYSGFLTLKDNNDSLILEDPHNAFIDWGFSFNDYGLVSDWGLYDNSDSSYIYLESLVHRDCNVMWVDYKDYAGLRHNYLMFKTATSTDKIYHYDINFLRTDNIPLVQYNYSFVNQVVVDAQDNNDTFDDNFYDLTIARNLSTYSFADSDEIPYNNDFLDDDSSAIYNRAEYSFDEYYLGSSNGTILSGNFEIGVDNTFKCYLVRYNYNTVDYQSGYADGYTNGNADGYRVGYSNGYAKGVDDTAQTNNLFFNLFGSIADTPILMLRSLFNFDLFGVNVLTAVLSLLTAIIVVFVIRKFI